MRAKDLTKLLTHSFRAGRRILIKGRPGIGKSDIVAQAAQAARAKLIISHPAISDPTDYKGMPALTAGGTRAEFLPFGDLQALIDASETTIAFLDDIGQAPSSVQAALMQLILARRVNGHTISPQVIFCGATNDTKDQAGVSGMIEPLKSRWETIIELDANIDDWCQWALGANMPAEVIAFLRFRPKLLSDFHPTRELRNSPCPRTWAAVGNWLNDGIMDPEVITGAVGQGAAVEFSAFLAMYRDLPSLEGIILDPVGASVPDNLGAKYAVATGLSHKSTPQNFERVTTYLERLGEELSVVSVRDALTLQPAIASTKPFAAWAIKHQNVLL